jgi:hypothetical protein
LRSEAWILRKLLVLRNWHVPCSVSPGTEQTRIGTVLFPTQTIVEQRIAMKKLSHLLTLVGFAAVISLGAGNLAAQERQDRQGRGNFDPEEMRQRMMERYRTELEVKSDDEWKLIEARITKVNDARREIGELKAKLAKVREARKQKEANLAKAQDELRKVLSVRQEATAVLMGLLQ